MVPRREPLDKELSVWDQQWQVVGVAGDVREFGLAQDFTPVFYLPARLVAPDRMQLLIRTEGEPLELAANLRWTVWSFDRSIPISELETLESRIADSLARPRFRMLMVGLFAGWR